ncbi:MAG TPA: prohibitin family protein [Gammaproteobacteria bacterium]|nr:prohibitin family protein [Gammaproteobacteria bacterium]
MRVIDVGAASRGALRTVALAVAGVLAVATLFGCWYTVDQGERAVVLRLGELIGENGPGLHFKLPWVNTVHKITVQNQNRRYTKLEAYSRDQQSADLTVSVTFMASDPSAVYSQYGDLDGAVARLIDPRVMSGVKTIFGQYDAVRAIQERAALNRDIDAAITAAITAPIQIVSVQVENIDFSEAYEQSVEQRMLAQVEIQKREENLRTTQVEAEIARTKAEGEANAIRLKGEAEAAAIKARADALRANADLVQLQAVEKWDGKLPTTMVPGSALPFLNMSTK